MISNELNRAATWHDRPDYYRKHLVLAMELMGKYYLSGVKACNNLQKI